MVRMGKSKMGIKWMLCASLCFGVSAANAQFPSENIELLSRLPLASMGGGGGNDIWGWTDSQTGREYALVGRTNGTSFVDVTDPTDIRYLGNLPSRTGASTWRDIKVYNDHAYVVSDQNGPHGIQIFDLTRLRHVGSPRTFNADANYNGIRNAHNIAINEDSGFAYVVGTNLGSRVLDLSNPLAPVDVAGVNIAHDVQAVNYDGPDADYAGREILIAAIGSSRITIQDVTDKSQIDNVSIGFYPGGIYSHQGWLGEDSRYFYLNDELDNKWTHVFDLVDLDQPTYLGRLFSTETATDHNLYVKGKYIYQANYAAGLQVFEIVDAATVDLRRVGWLDTNAANDFGFDGAWSVYPFFDSGTIIVSDRENGLFVARLDLFDGDFNYDGELDCADIDALVAAIASSEDDVAFDLTGDGTVDLLDRDAWLAEAAAANLQSNDGYLVGDANLDGVVDVTDLNIWSGQKFQAAVGWCGGDFNADGTSDVSDLNLWSANKFRTAGDAAAVPEPHALVMGLIAWAWLPLAIRRR